MRITCHFCRASVESIGEAVLNDWVPSFYGPGDTIPTDQPVCPDCASEYLEADDDGELVRVADPQFDQRPPR